MSWFRERDAFRPEISRGDGGTIYVNAPDGETVTGVTALLYDRDGDGTTVAATTVSGSQVAITVPPDFDTDYDEDYYAIVTLTTDADETYRERVPFDLVLIPLPETVVTLNDVRTHPEADRILTRIASHTGATRDRIFMDIVDEVRGQLQTMFRQKAGEMRTIRARLSFDPHMVRQIAKNLALKILHERVATFDDDDPNTSAMRQYYAMARDGFFQMPMRMADVDDEGELAHDYGQVNHSIRLVRRRRGLGRGPVVPR